MNTASNLSASGPDPGIATLSLDLPEFGTGMPAGWRKPTLPGEPFHREAPAGPIHPPGMNATAQLVAAPASDTAHTYQPLAYAVAHDAVLDRDYAFVAYKETDCGGDWRVRIKSSQTPGAVFEPALMQSNARRIWAQGRPWFRWGYSLDPGDGDPRCIQFRVHVVEARPSAIEMLVRLRRFDGTAAEACSVKFAWPA